MIKCGFCSKSSEKLLQCVCGKAWYCDKNCQKLNWKIHKKDCPPFAIKDVDQKGRGLIATRNLPRGSCVFKENSFFASDKIEIDENKMLHKFFKLTREKQADVLSLHDPEGSVKDDSESATGAKLKRIFDENYNAVTGPFYGTTYQLFINASLINHSCNPNSFLVMGTENVPHPFAKLITFVEVKKGEELTQNYYYTGLMTKQFGWLKYYDRQMVIKQDYNFDCKCENCLKGCKPDLLREQHRFLDTMIEENKKKSKPCFALAEKKLQLGRLFDNGLMFDDMIDCFVASSKEKHLSVEIFEKDIKYKSEFKIFMNTGAFDGVLKPLLIEELGLDKIGN